MVDYNTPVTDGELHAYVDGELPPDRSEAVEAWLASHPEDAGRVAAWRVQAEAIRARYGATIHGPVPDRLTLSRITRSQQPATPAASHYPGESDTGAAGKSRHRVPTRTPQTSQARRPSRADVVANSAMRS